MNIAYFSAMIVILCAVSALFTEALKQFCDNGNISFSPNLAALICSAVVGGGGTVAFYILTGVAWTLPTIVTLIIAIFAIWIGAMVGYDKVVQLIEQIKNR